MNDYLKYLYYKLTPGRKRWYPFLSVYYLTYRCRFRCPYCSDGSGTPYHQLEATDPTGDTALETLRGIRKHCDNIVITGGEPLEHAEFSYVLEQLPKLKFKEVILTTNGRGLEKYLREIAGAVDTLVFSIDTLDRAKANSWYGMGEGTLVRIVDSIGEARNYKGRKYKILISAVVTPENISDLYEVYRFAKQSGFGFAAAPQLQGVVANAELNGNEAYRRFFDFLIKEKQAGADIFGIPEYLEAMRDLGDFKCYPFTMLVVGPCGEVFYPCLEIGHNIGNIMEGKSLHKLRREGEKRFGPQPECGTQCHSACALGFSLLLKNPFLFKGEHR
ncbi:MAG: radical SAM protein [bacterium]|nr:radical SAM protein [bacterium]